MHLSHFWICLLIHHAFYFAQSRFEIYLVRTLIPIVALATFCITTNLIIGPRVIDMNACLTYLDVCKSTMLFILDRADMGLTC